MRIHLKVKSESLAAEARIIRNMERKYRKWKSRAQKKAYRKEGRERTYQGSPKLRESLRRHRIKVVRPEARHTHLAYGFLRGRRYRQIEPRLRDSTPRPDWDRVAAMVAKYGGLDKRDAAQKLAEWSAVPAEAPVEAAA